MTKTNQITTATDAVSQAKAKLLVMQKRCSECLFSPNKIVDDVRKEEILADCKAEERYFICHQDSAKAACCRGFFDSELTQAIQILKRRWRAGAADDLIEWVETAPKNKPTTLDLV